MLERGLSVSAAELNRLRREVLMQLSAVRGRRSEPELGAYSEPSRAPGSKNPPLLTISVRKTSQVTARLLALKPAVLYVPLSEILAQPESYRALAGRQTVAAILPRVVRDDEMPASFPRWAGSPPSASAAC